MNSAVLKEVQSRQLAFLEQVPREFQGFPSWVQKAFAGEAGLNGVRGNSADGVSVPSGMSQPFSDAQISYLVIRTYLWRGGYSQNGHPASLFSAERIAGPDEAKFLNKSIQNGIDRAMLAKLQATEAAIPQILGTSLVSPTMRTIIGFQPRRTIGYDSLSNHAFGDAVDIDAEWNPLLSGDVSRAIQKHSGIDFSAERITPDKNIDTLVQELTAGSNTFAQWMQTNLPQFEQLQDQFDQASADLAQAMQQEAQARTQAEKDAAAAAAAKASRELTDAIDKLAAPDMADVSVLYDALHKDKTLLQNLTQTGYLTLGAELVKVLTDPNGGGFLWDGSWKGDRKDFMHFDFKIPAPDVPPR
jgi:hypothetical protein